MIIESQFKAAWWAKNAHLQTIWSSFFRGSQYPQTTTQRLELPDGDFIELEWLTSNHLQVSDDAPVLLLLHGLEGSIESSYIQGLLTECQKLPWKIAVLHFRGCGKESNRLPRSYHSGETEDLGHALNKIKHDHAQSKIMVAGFSLGGNVLLKYLGESKTDSLIDYAAAVSVPFLLGAASKRLDKGFSRLYRNRLLEELKRKFINKYEVYSEKLSLSKSQLSELNTFYDFDDQVTAPLHDFDGADDYYQQCSSRQFIKEIQTQTLILHAKDDPFMVEDIVPTEQELSKSVTLELSGRGGHVGFVSGNLPWRAEYYIDQRLPQWFKEQLIS